MIHIRESTVYHMIIFHIIGINWFFFECYKDFCIPRRSINSKWEKVPFLLKIVLVIPFVLDQISDLIVQYFWRSKKNILYICFGSTILFWSHSHLMKVLQLIFIETIPSLLATFRQMLRTEILVKGLLHIWHISYTPYIIRYIRFISVKPGNRNVLNLYKSP